MYHIDNELQYFNIKTHEIVRLYRVVRCIFKQLFQHTC